MPVEMLQQPQRKAVSPAAGAAPPRLRPKRPVGPDFYRRIPATAGSPKQSAVERLEADKAKYVKSQVALSKKQPVKPPELKQPLLNPSTPLRPTRKTTTPVTTKPEEVQLDLEHLSNLINNVPVEPQPGAVSLSEDAKAPAHNSISDSPPCVQQIKKKPRPPPRPPPRPLPRPFHSGPAEVTLKAPGPVMMENLGSGAAVIGTVRRVDVMPQLGPARITCRPPQYIRQPLQPRPLQYQQLLQPAPLYQRLFQTRPPPCPRKPVDVSVKLPSSSSPPAAASPPSTLPAFPPPSPSITRLSSTSSRKRPSLTRSKSDMSDRYSRAGTELERFFNLCGLDPSELQELAASSSDIVSLARFRSVSAPGSECGGSDRGGEDEEEEEDEDAGRAANRVPYGVSVIERNARVIKWLYGLRQAKENTSTSTNL